MSKIRRYMLAATVTAAAAAAKAKSSAADAAMSAQNSADAAAIRQCVLDYVEGWYEGKAERMSRALHPDLQKRIVEKDPQSGNDRLREMSAQVLIQYTREGRGTETPQDRQQKDITIFDIYLDEASAKVVFLDWVDFLHLARFDGRWVIVNVLWQRKPKASPNS